MFSCTHPIQLLCLIVVEQVFIFLFIATVLQIPFRTVAFKKPHRPTIDAAAYIRSTADAAHVIPVWLLIRLVKIAPNKQEMFSYTQPINQLNRALVFYYS